MSDPFEALRAYVMAFGDGVQETTLRFYIAFKRINNVADKSWASLWHE